jgi:hypothetical protein
MKLISTFRLALMAGLIGCASAQVNTDWDGSTRFNNYHTYAWMETPNMQALQQGTLFDRPLRLAVEEQLTAKGLRKSSSTGEADILLVYHAGAKDKIDVQQWGYFGRRVDVREYTQGTLVIDIIDAKSKSLVWRATATDEVSGSGASREKIAKTVQKMFERFPTT